MKNQKPDFIAVVSGDDDVLRGGGKRRKSAHPQPPDVNPGRAGELEIFREPSGEFDAARRFVLTGEAARVAHFIKAFFVKSRIGEVRLFPIAGSDVRSSHAQLVSARIVHRNHLQFIARCR